MYNRVLTLSTGTAALSYIRDQEVREQHSTISIKLSKLAAPTCYIASCSYQTLGAGGNNPYTDWGCSLLIAYIVGCFADPQKLAQICG